MGFYIITFKLDLGKMEQQWLSNVHQNSSKTGPRIDIFSAYLAKSSFISMEVLRKQRFLSQDCAIWNTFPGHWFYPFAEVCQECVAGWAAKEPFVSSQHLQLSQLKHCDLDPPYPVSSLASQRCPLTTDPSHLKGHREPTISPQTPCFLLWPFKMLLFL